MQIKQISSGFWERQNIWCWEVEKWHQIKLEKNLKLWEKKKLFAADIGFVATMIQCFLSGRRSEILLLISLNPLVSEIWR